MTEPLRRASRTRHFIVQQTRLLLSLLILLATLGTYVGLYQSKQGHAPTSFDWTNLINNSLPLIIAALGQGIVVLTGGIDLSVGGMINLSNSMAARWLTGSPLHQALMTIVLLATGALGGLANGLLVAVVRLQPILVTLATLSVFQGLALWVLPVPGGAIPPGFTSVLSNYDGPTGLLWIAAFAGLWLVFRRTRLGVGVLAVGNDAEAARANGLAHRRLVVSAYMLGGLLSAASGLFLAATTTAGDPTTGNPYVLGSIAAVVLGGISLSGGRGSLLGAIAGALTLTLVGNVLFFADINPLYQSFYQGLFLIVAVLLGAVVGRLARFAR